MPRYCSVWIGLLTCLSLPACHVVAAIAHVHSLTLEQVRNVRVTRTRDWRMAMLAAVPFALLYSPDCSSSRSLRCGDTV